MPDFLGTKTIKMYLASRQVPISLIFSVCSNSTANNGALPYGDKIVSAEVTAWTPNKVDETALMVSDVVVNRTGLIVSCKLSGYTGCPVGTHKLVCTVTTLNGMVQSFSANRIVVSL